VTVSDREITAGDVEYEPPQFKVSFQTKRAMILIAGDYPTHSEALQQTQKIIRNTSEDDPATIAEIYASSLRQVKFKHACDICLSPLGLASNIFSANSGVPNELLMSLANQVVNYAGQPTEAIVAAADDLNAHLYLVDSEGKVTCHDDVGFVAIEIGAWHAKSLLMQARYYSGNSFATALSLAYWAKKRAEVAPGVGKSTDMFFVNKIGWSLLAPDLQSAIERSHEEYDKRHIELLDEQQKRLAEAFAEVAAKAGIAAITAPQAQTLPTPAEGKKDETSDNKSAAAD